MKKLFISKQDKHDLKEMPDYELFMKQLFTLESNKDNNLFYEFFMRHSVL